MKTYICIEKNCNNTVHKAEIRCHSCANKLITDKLRFKLNDIKKVYSSFGCTLLEKEYKNSKTSMQYLCSCGNYGKTTFIRFKKRIGCKYCAQKGKIVSDITKKKMSLNHANFSGRNHPMFGVRRYGNKAPGYIDGRTSLHRILKNLPDYVLWRTKVFKRDNFTCQECGDNRGGNLEAHHIKAFAEILHQFLQQYNQFSPIEDKETLIRLALNYKSFWNIKNGITLCLICHAKKHSNLFTQRQILIGGK
jgi:hypothetical protein